MNKNGFSEFTSVSRDKAREIQLVAVDRTEESQKEERQGWPKRVNDIPQSYKKLLVKTAACAVLLLGIWGIKNLDYDVVLQNGVQATADEPGYDEDDLGRLKFVSGEEVSVTEGYSLPITGEVVESFSDTQKDVKIKGIRDANVMSILSGTVIKTGEDTIVVENTSGTVTTYTGVAPTVESGDRVESSQVIGVLKEEILCMETVSGIGYVDSLDADDLSSTTDGLES